jgi:hypothetical protein
MALFLVAHRYGALPPANPTNHTSPTPPGGTPPECVLGTRSPYNSILDEGRAFQPVRLRAALVTGVYARLGATRYSNLARGTFKCLHVLH